MLGSPADLGRPCHALAVKRELLPVEGEGDLVVVDDDSVHAAVVLLDRPFLVHLPHHK